MGSSMTMKKSNIDWLVTWVIAHDPGKSQGWACLEPSSRIYSLANSFQDLRYPIGVQTVLAVEGQFAAPKKAGKKALATLGFRAGFAIGMAVVGPETLCVLKLEPKVWKPKLYRGGATMKKTVFNNRIKRDYLSRVDTDWLENLNEDCIDAGGIAIAVPKLTDKEFKENVIWSR